MARIAKTHLPHRMGLAQSAEAAKVERGVANEPQDSQTRETFRAASEGRKPRGSGRSRKRSRKEE